MTCLRCQHGTANRFGTYGRLRIQRFRCTTCRATFTAPRKRPLGRHYTDAVTATQIVTLLMEGMSVRAVSRITGVHQGTILSLLLTVGKNSRKYPSAFCTSRRTLDLRSHESEKSFQ
jgi:transposase-like protein